MGKHTAPSRVTRRRNADQTILVTLVEGDGSTLSNLGLRFEVTWELGLDAGEEFLGTMSGTGGLIGGGEGKGKLTEKVPVMVNRVPLISPPKVVLATLSAVGTRPVEPVSSVERAADWTVAMQKQIARAIILAMDCMMIAKTCLMERLQREIQRLDNDF